jgi:hypothetical protein
MEESSPSVRRLKGAWTKDRLGAQILRMQLRKRVGYWANSMKIRDFIKPPCHFLKPSAILSFLQVEVIPIQRG